MRIGLSGGGPNVDRVIRQVEEAERDGFSSVWFPGALGGDPLVAMAVAGRATETIELGTAVLQTYPCHPLLMAQRVGAVAAAVGPGRFTLGIGPSHAVLIEGSYGMSYARAGQHTEEYVRIVTAALRGEAVDVQGQEVSGRGAGWAGGAEAPVPVLVSALAPRLLRVAGELAAGTITWMANARAIDTHVAPRLSAAAGGGEGRRIVVGLPLAVHDDVAAAREEAAKQFGFYGDLPAYRRILEVGGAAGPADAAIVGDEDAVTAQVRELFDAGATDLWAAPFPVGDDRSASRARTRGLLSSLARG